MSRGHFATAGTLTLGASLMGASVSRRTPPETTLAALLYS
jgi:hypothetical protein